MMLLLVAILTTLNLCAGYVLGVYVGVLPWTAAKLSSVPPEAELDFSDSISQPIAAPQPVASDASQAPAAAPAPQPEADPAPHVAADSGPEPVAEPAPVPSAPLFTADQLSAASEPTAGPTEEATAGENKNSPEPVETSDQQTDEQAQPSTSEVMQGLATFQQRLADASGTDAPADDAVEQDAQEHDSQAVSPDAESASKDESETDPSQQEPPEISGGLKQIDQLIGEIDQLVASEGGQHLVLAAVRPDPVQLAEGVDVEDVDTRLLNSLAQLVQELTEQAHGMACNTNGQLLIALPGDTPEVASRRIDTFRQQVEKTTFDAGETKINATVTCAIAEAGDVPSRQALLDHLEEALGESERHGSNRSYHHDGRFPAPALPEEATIEPRTVTL